MLSMIPTAACARSSRRRQTGFSLVELAIVLVILGLLTGGGLVAFEAVSEQTHRSEQRRQLETVRTALYGFAMGSGRLPCPDSKAPAGMPWPDGQEDVAGGECDSAEGALPWVDLGVGRRDAWGFPLRYRVMSTTSDEPNFADEAPDGDSATFGIGDEGALEIHTAESAVDSEGDVAENVVAVVVSYGSQGGQVWTATGFVCTTSASNGFSADEHENSDCDRHFVDAGYRPQTVDDGFDDMLMWIPYPVLSARMVDAGLLP